MISWLQGKLKSKDKSTLLIEVSGVGYEVQISLLTYCRLPDCGTQMELYTHFIVREDEQALYGFTDLKERALFRILLKVNGVGPKLALAILSNIDPDTLVMMVKGNDRHRLMKTPGIGKKTAERLVIELSDRLKDWQYEELLGNVQNSQGTQSNAEVTADSDAHIKANASSSNTASLRPVSMAAMTRDAVSALIGLGYSPQEASRAVSEVMSDSSHQEVEQIVRLALRGMARDRV